MFGSFFNVSCGKSVKQEIKDSSYSKGKRTKARNQALFELGVAQAKASRKQVFGINKESGKAIDILNDREQIATKNYNDILNDCMEVNDKIKVY